MIPSSGTYSGTYKFSNVSFYYLFGMPVYVCAVADCDSTSKKPDVSGWVKFPKRTDGIRKSLWETRCKRGPKWKATNNHAICSRHFIDWCQGPSPSHPNPELFAYNNWGKKEYVRRSIYKRQRVRNMKDDVSTHQETSEKIKSHQIPLLLPQQYNFKMRNVIIPQKTPI